MVWGNHGERPRSDPCALVGKKQLNKRITNCKLKCSMKEIRASQVALVVKNSPAMQETWDAVRSLSQEDPCRRAWQLTPVFLPGESHGQRSLVGYSPWGCKETQLKQLSMHAMHEGNKQETGTERTRGRVAHMAHTGTQDKLCWMREHTWKVVERDSKYQK